MNSGCANVIYEDRSGNIWIGLDDNLYRYSPASASTEQIALPSAPADLRFGYLSGMTEGPEGDLWITLALCGGASCWGENIYHLTECGWEQVGEPSDMGGEKILFDATGQPWLFSAGSVYQVSENTLQPIAGLIVQAATTDDDGNLWLVAQSAGPPTLWKLEP